MTRASVALMALLVFASLGCEEEDEPPLTPPVNVRPEAITDLEASGTATSVTLRWTAPADGEAASGTTVPASVSAYEIRHATARLSEQTWNTGTVLESPEPSAPGTTEIAEFDGVEPGAHYFAVRSMDADSAWSPLSNQPLVTVAGIDGDAPRPINDLTAALETATTVRLRWAAPLDSLGTVSAYQGRMARVPITNANWHDSPVIASPPSVLPPGDIQTWIASGLTEPGIYYFAIRSVDDSDNVSRTSNVASVTVLPDLTPPQSVQDLTVSASNDDTIDLVWTATGSDGTIGRAASYEFRWSTSEITASNWEEAVIAPDPPVPAPTGTREAFSVHGLPSGTRVWIALRASDEAGNMSALSNVVSGVTENESTPPARITDLRVEELTSASLVLRWTAPGDDGNLGRAARYDLRMSLVPIDPARFDSYPDVVMLPPEPAGTAEHLLLRDLREGALFFAIRAVDEVGNAGAVSNVLRVDVPPDAFAPDPITDLAVVSAEGRSVFITWSAPADLGRLGRAYRYELRYSTAPIDETNWETAREQFGLPVPSPSGSREYMEVVGLEENTTYFIGIRSWDESGNRSLLSNIASARTRTSGSMVIRPDGTGDFPTIQDALDAAGVGATIELEDGVFTGARNRNLQFPPVPVVLRSRSRDPELCTIDCVIPGTDEVVAVSGASPLVAGTLIEGITFRRGRSQTGGAIQLVDSNVSIWRCRFIENRLRNPNLIGAAVIQLTNSKLDLQDCLIQNNVGEPIFVDWESDLIGARCRFVENEAQFSSGIYIEGGTVLLSECELRGGCKDPGEESSFCGSLVFCESGDIEIHNSLLEGPQGTSVRSPIRLHSGATGRIYDSTFLGHRAQSCWGVLYTFFSDLLIERCRFSSVVSSGRPDQVFPGLIAGHKSAVTIRNTIIDPISTPAGDFEASIAWFTDSQVLIENTISYGAVFPEAVGGASFTISGDSDVTLRGSTFLEGGCSFCTETNVPTVRFDGKSLNVERCIFYGNPHGSAILADEGLVTISCTDIYGNSFDTGDEVSPRNWPGWMAGLLGVDGNIETDPLFCNPGALDLRLRPESPCAPSGPGNDCGRMGGAEVGCR